MKKIILILAILGALLQYAAPFALKFYAPYALQDKLQGNLKIGNLRWNLFVSTADIGDVVFTPNTAEKPLVEIKTAHVAFDKLWANPMIIDRIVFEGVQGTITRNADGSLNTNKILETLRQQKNAEKPTTAKIDGLKVVVKTFELRDVVVQNFVGSTDPTKPLNEIKLQTALVENIGTVEKPLLLKDLPRELLGWVLRQQMQALPALAVDGMVGKAKKALDSVGDTLKNIFGN